MGHINHIASTWMNLTRTDDPVQRVVKVNDSNSLQFKKKMSICYIECDLDNAVNVRVS